VVLSETGQTNLHVIAGGVGRVAELCALAKVPMPLAACALGGLSFRPSPSVLLWLEVNRASLWL
jgi:hypothetical protein